MFSEQIVVAQAQYADKEHEHLVPQATSFATFLQLIGSSTGLPYVASFRFSADGTELRATRIAGAVFSASLTSNLNGLSSTLSQETISAIHVSIKAIFDLLTPGSAERDAAIVAYVNAVRMVWLVCVPSAALAGFTAIIIGRGKLRKLEGM